MENLLFMVMVLTCVSIITSVSMTVVVVISLSKVAKICNPSYQEEVKARKEDKLERKATRKANRKAMMLKMSLGIKSLQLAYLKLLLKIKTRKDNKKRAEKTTIRKEFINMAMEDAARVARERRSEVREAKTVDFNYVVNSLNAELTSQQRISRSDRRYTIKALVYQNIYKQYIVADAYIVGDHSAIHKLSEFCELNESIAKEVDQYLFNYEVLKVINVKLANDRGFGKVRDIDDELMFSHIKRGLDDFAKDTVVATMEFKVPVLASELRIIADLFNPNLETEHIEREVAADVVLKNVPVNSVSTEEVIVDAEEVSTNSINKVDMKMIEQMIELTKVQGLPTIQFNEETLEFEPATRTPEQIQQAVNATIGHTKEIIDYVIALTSVNNKPTQRYNASINQFEYIVDSSIEKEVAVDIIEEVEESTQDDINKSLDNVDEFYKMLERLQKGENIEVLLDDTVTPEEEEEEIDIYEAFKAQAEGRATQAQLDEINSIKTFIA